MVCHQGGLAVNGGWVLGHQGGLSSGWYVIRVVCHQGGLAVMGVGARSSRSSDIIRVVYHQGRPAVIMRVVCRQGGLAVFGGGGVGMLGHQGDLAVSGGWRC